MADITEDPSSRFGLSQYLQMGEFLRNRAVKEQAVEQQKQFIRDRAALGDQPTAEQLQEIVLKNINDPNTLADILNKRREYIPIGTGLYSKGDNTVISPPERPTSFGDVHNVPGGYISRKPEGGYEFTQTQQDRPERGPSIHTVEDKTSPTGFSYEDFNTGMRRPGAPVPKNSLNLAGGRESVYIQRMMMGANQASKDLANVVQLPLTASTGFFGGRKQGPGLFDAGKEVLANKATGQEAQAYNAMATGFQRSLAQIESAGLMPSGSLTHQMDAVLFKEGDTNLTKLHKLAQTRQIVEAGMEVIEANPRVTPEEKAKVKEVLANIRKSVPFTHSDLIRLQVAQETDPNATLGSVLNSQPAWRVIR